MGKSSNNKLSTTEIRKLVTMQKKIVSINGALSKIIDYFDDENIKLIADSYQKTCSKILKDRLNKNNSLADIKNKLKNEIETANLTENEIRSLLSELFGVAEVSKTKKVKYRAEITNNGFKETIEWSGRGRMPPFFRNLKDGEIDDYLVEKD